jgi:EmrB/QacA subfamily drug resistance transporter
VSIELPPGRRRYILGACLAAIFTTAVEGTIVATAMPTIVGDLGGFSLLSWVFAAYMLPQAVTIPIYGRLADLYGRRRVLVTGLAIFLTGSALCSFAPSMLVLVLFRALQGIGAGAVMPVTMTIVGDIYPPIERIRIQPYMASMFGGASIIGPVIGAFVVNELSWRLVFWFNVPIGALATVLIWSLLTERPRKVEHNIDAFGAALLMTGIGALVLPMLQAAQLRWWCLPLLALSAGCLFLFWRLEKSAQEPLLPVALWRNRTILAANLFAFTIGATVTGISAFLPTYLQGVMHRTVLQAGLMLTVMTVAWPIASVFGTRLTLATSYRTTITAGSTVFLAGSLILPTVAIASGDAALRYLGDWWPGVAAILIGAGIGMCNATLQVSVQEASGPRARGAAMASYNFMRILGATFGAAILGAVLNFSLFLRPANIDDPVQVLMDHGRQVGLSPERIASITNVVAAALHNVFWATAAIALFGLAVARLMPRGLRPGIPTTDGQQG